MKKDALSKKINLNHMSMGKFNILQNYLGTIYHFLWTLHLTRFPKPKNIMNAIYSIDSTHNKQDKLKIQNPIIKPKKPIFQKSPLGHQNLFSTRGAKAHTHHGSRPTVTNEPREYTP